MSVESIAICLHHSRARGTTKLVLIGIANHDGDGGAWPTVARLAVYAQCSRSSVQRAIAELERLGEIRRYVQAGGDHRYAEHERPNRYSVLLRCPADCDRSSQHRTAKSAQIVLELEPEQLEGAAPVGPGQRGPQECGPVASVGREGAAPVGPKPSSQLTTHLPETKPAYRASKFELLWSDERCPGNWKTQTHDLASNGKCKHCHETPQRFNTETGEPA